MSRVSSDEDEENVPIQRLYSWSGTKGPKNGQSNLSTLMLAKYLPSVLQDANGNMVD